MKKRIDPPTILGRPPAPTPDARGLPWFDAGNVATGVIAIGNVATGFLAIGNVARGVITFGNVSVGIVSFGNVGFGVLFGAGATVGVGLVSMAGVLALSVLQGAAGLLALVQVTPLLGLVPPAIWLLASRIGRGQWGPRPLLPPLVSADDLLQGKATHGWIRGALRAVKQGNLIAALSHGREEELRATEVAAQDAAFFLETRRTQALLEVEREERPVPGDPGMYREAPKLEARLHCLTVQEAPRRVPFYHAHEVQFVLRWAWQLGAGLGLVLWLAGLFLR